MIAFNFSLRFLLPSSAIRPGNLIVCDTGLTHLFSISWLVVCRASDHLTGLNKSVKVVGISNEFRY